MFGLLSVSKVAAIRHGARAYIHVMRGVPLLMVIFFMYFLLPAAFGQPIPETWTVIAALALFASAYMSQIVRAGIDSVPLGQREAAVSTGLKPWQVMWFIVLPQGLRNMIPSFVNEFVSLIKDTSLAFIVGVSELTHVATQINNRTMIHPAEVFLFIAVVYFAICFALTSVSRRLERRLA
jgi:polar amino acid transport system permease protein